MLESPQKGDSNKYPKHMLLEILMQYSCIIPHSLSPLEQRFRDFQTVIVTNCVVVSSVGIKRVDCTLFVFISAQKHRLWVLVRRGSSNEYLQSMFCAEM